MPQHFVSMRAGCLLFLFGPRIGASIGLPRGGPVPVGGDAATVPGGAATLKSLDCSGAFLKRTHEQGFDYVPASTVAAIDDFHALLVSLLDFKGSEVQPLVRAWESFRDELEQCEGGQAAVANPVRSEQSTEASEYPPLLAEQAARSEWAPLQWPAEIALYANMLKFWRERPERVRAVHVIRTLRPDVYETVIHGPESNLRAEIAALKPLGKRHRKHSPTTVQNELGGAEANVTVSADEDARLRALVADKDQARIWTAGSEVDEEEVPSFNATPTSFELAQDSISVEKEVENLDEAENLYTEEPVTLAAPEPSSTENAFDIELLDKALGIERRQSFIAALTSYIRSQIDLKDVLKSRRSKRTEKAAAQAKALIEEGRAELEKTLEEINCFSLVSSLDDVELLQRTLDRLIALEREREAVSEHLRRLKSMNKHIFLKPRTAQLKREIEAMKETGSILLSDEQRRGLMAQTLEGVNPVRPLRTHIAKRPLIHV